MAEEFNAADGTVNGLEVREISKSFGASIALNQVSLTVCSGEIHVLVGQNGSGKSTLIKTLSGYHEPDPGGEIRLGGMPVGFGSPEDVYRLGCRFVHQDLGLVLTSSVLDNLSLSAGYATRGGTIRWRESLEDARAMLDRVGLSVDPRERVARLTASQRTGVAIARALRDDPSHPPRVLVLDEPTSTLPPNEVDHLLHMLRAAADRGVAVLYVTHHLQEVFRIADRVTILRDGRVINTSPVHELDRASLIAYLVGEDVAEVRREDRPSRALDQAPALAVSGVRSASLGEVSLSVGSGELVGIAGLTGSGRESLLGVVFGSEPRSAGSVEIAGTKIRAGRPDLSIRAGMAFLPADRKADGGIMSLSAQENLTLPTLGQFWSGLRLRRKSELAETTRWFRSLQVRPAAGARSLLSVFSGGNQQKILFGKWIRQAPRAFLLNEPTQGVDVGAKAELHKLLLELAGTGTAVIISSTDIEELAALCHRILILHDGRIAGELVGSEITPNAIARRVMPAVQD